MKTGQFPCVVCLWKSVGEGADAQPGRAVCVSGRCYRSIVVTAAAVMCGKRPWTRRERQNGGHLHAPATMYFMIFSCCGSFVPERAAASIDAFSLRHLSVCRTASTALAARDTAGLPSAAHMS